MSKNQQNFEDLIRETLEQFEVDYNPSHWEEMESRLNLIGQGLAVSMQSFYTAFVAAGIFLAGLIYFGLPGEPGSGFAAASDQEEKTELTDSSGVNTAGNSSNATSEKEIASANHFVMEVPQNTVERTAELEDTPENASAEGQVNESEKPKNVEYGDFKVKKIKSSVAQGCEGTPITFSTSGSDAQGNYLWNFGDGIFSSEQNPNHVFQSPGVFDVSLLVTPLKGGKLTPMTIEDQIKINPRPKASFDYTYRENQLKMPEVKFENHTKNADKAVWLINDEVVSEDNSLAHNFSKKGVYRVALVAINDHGCADTTYKDVKINSDYNLLAPESFTPEKAGAAGLFMPEALRMIDGDFVMHIIDPKTDMVIFESTDINNPWDGKIAGTSVKASSGIYQWEVSITNKNGTTDIFNGTVKLQK
jgi:PKD repeat protein